MSNENVFKNKNFLLLFQGSLTSCIAATLYSFAMSFYILEITDNNAMIQGIFLAMCSLVFVLFSLVGGIVADRMDKVKIVYGTDFIKGIFILLSMIPLIIGIKNNIPLLQIITLFVVGFVNNALAAIFSPASSALLPELVDENKLQQANSYFSILNSFVGIIGVVLGSFLYSALPLQLLFLIVGALYILSGISELFIKNQRKVIKEDKITFKVMRKDFFDTFVYLKQMKGIVACIIGVIFLNFFFTIVEGNVFPYVINKEVASSDYLGKGLFEATTWSAIVTVCLSIGSIIMGIILSKQKQKQKYGKSIKTSISMITIFVCIMCLIYVFTSKININYFLIGSAVCMFFVGISITANNVPVSILMQTIIPQDRLAKVSSLTSLLSQGLCPFASLLGGTLITFFGINGLLIACMVGFVIASVYIVVNKEIAKL